MSGDIRSSDSEDISEGSDGANVHIGNGDAFNERWQKNNKKHGKKHLSAAPPVTASGS